MFASSLFFTGSDTHCVLVVAFGPAVVANENLLHGHGYKSNSNLAGTSKRSLPMAPELRTVMTGVAATHTKVLNYINGSWMESKSADWKEVLNPATGETIALTPLSTAAEVDAAVQGAAAAYYDWRRTPAEDRIQPLFKLKMLLENHVDELGRIIAQ